MNQDLQRIARHMEDCADSAECEGLDMAEYDEYLFDPAFRQRVKFAMLRWEGAVADLQQAVRELKVIAEEMPT